MYIGSVVKLKMYENEDYLNMIIGYTDDGYVTVLHPYGLVDDKLIIVKECDIIKEVHKGYDSRISTSLGGSYEL